jgi:hypothetical protein
MRGSTPHPGRARGSATGGGHRPAFPGLARSIQDRSRGLAASLGTLVLGAALAATTLAVPAAQAAEGDEAQRLFIEGREALLRGDQATACARFRSSLALARVVNTLFNVAQCDERDGKLALALAGLREGVQRLAPGDERLAPARERLTALEARVPMVTLTPAADFPADAKVLLDGAAVAQAVTAPVPLDPGEHTIAVEAPGHKTARFALTVAERDRKELVISAGPLEARRDTGPEGTQKLPPPPPPLPGGSQTRRTAGFIAGAIGLAGLAAFGVTGGILLERDGRIQAACPDRTCTPAGRELIDGSAPLMVANAVSLGVGIAGAGLGAVLVLTGRSNGGTAPAAAALVPVALPGGGGVALAGRF